MGGVDGAGQALGGRRGFDAQPVQGAGFVFKDLEAWGLALGERVQALAHVVEVGDHGDLLGALHQGAAVGGQARLKAAIGLRALAAKIEEHAFRSDCGFERRQDATRGGVDLHVTRERAGRAPHVHHVVAGKELKIRGEAA